MANGRRARGRFVRGTRRGTLWGGTADVTTFTALAAGAAVVDQTFTQAILEPITPMTIIRHRGWLFVKSDQVAAQEEPFGGWGIAVVSEQARIAGAAAIPSPIAENDSDLFMAWGAWAASGGPIEGQPVSSFEIDSKAMRKFEEGMAIVTLIENGSSVHGAEYMFVFRTLFKLA